MAKKRSSPPAETCPYCSAIIRDKENRILRCPQCGREGCYECMPAGTDCACPECDEGID